MRYLLNSLIVSCLYVYHKEGKMTIQANKQRLNTTLPKKTIEKLEQYSQQFGMSKSSAIALIVETYFQQQEVIERSREMPGIIDKLTELANKVKKDN